MTMVIIDALKDEKDKAFATHKKLKLGPGDYNAEYSQTKARSQVVYLDEKQVGNQEKAKFQNKKTYKLFDGSGATIKHLRPVVKIAQLEERYQAPPFDENVKASC